MDHPFDGHYISFFPEPFERAFIKEIDVGVRFQCVFVAWLFIRYSDDHRFLRDPKEFVNTRFEVRHVFQRFAAEDDIELSILERQRVNIRRY